METGPNVLNLALTTRLLRAQMSFVSADFSKLPLPEWLSNVKLAAVTLFNIADLAKQTRYLYEKHRDLSDRYREFERAVEFARYLRNIFVGHQNEALIAKAAEWRPEIRFLVASDRSGVDVVLNLLVIETAINTYVEAGGEHKLFDSETDLVYPPDMERFNDFLNQTLRDCTGYLNALLQTLLSSYTEPAGDGFELFIKAGSTEFAFVTKGKR